MLISLFKKVTFFFFLLSGSITLASNINTNETTRSYKERQKKLNSKDVIDWLKKGNENFLSGKSNHGGYLKNLTKRRVIASKKQKPLAVVLSCIDSRTSPEIIFDTTIGDLFVARVAGNVINDDILGSIEISVASGAKVIVVLGHSDCGAIKGACKGIEFGHLTQLLNRVKPSISATNLILDNDPVLSQLIGERVVENKKYVAQISHTNANKSREELYRRSSIIREKVDSGEVVLVSALYNVNSGLVLFDKKQGIDRSIIHSCHSDCIPGCFCR